MSPAEVTKTVFELFGGKMRLTAMTLDNSKPRYLEQNFHFPWAFEILKFNRDRIDPIQPPMTIFLPRRVKLVRGL